MMKVAERKGTGMIWLVFVSRRGIVRAETPCRAWLHGIRRQDPFDEPNSTVPISNQMSVTPVESSQCRRYASSLSNYPATHACGIVQRAGVVAKAIRGGDLSPLTHLSCCFAYSEKKWKGIEQCSRTDNSDCREARCSAIAPQSSRFPVR